MLKKKLRLFLGLVVLAGSACVTPTHASSAFPSVVITHVQTGSPSSPLSEFVAVHNTSLIDVDLTGWCLTNKAHVRFACLSEGAPAKRFILPAASSATLASIEYADEFDTDLDAFSVAFTVTNHSSGSIVSSSDVITLVDASDLVVDTFSWSASPGSGNQFQRVVLLPSPVTYAITGAASDWRIVSLANSGIMPRNQVVVHTSNTEAPPSDDSGGTVGEGNVEEPSGDDTPDVDPGTSNNDPPVSAPLRLDAYITELLPNPEGADSGNEFIELYNPNDIEIPLSAYRLRVGVNLENVYAFPEDAVVPALSYASFTNAAIKYTLLNTTSTVQLMRDGVSVGEQVRYESPKSGSSWALIDAAWVYTNTPTSGAINQGMTQEGDSDAGDEASEAKSVALVPCAPNQYRSPTTNRCRLIATASVSATPAVCKEGQQRNPATNRCVTIAASKTPAPCKDGQERSSETNRCVTVKKMINTNYGVMGAAAKQGEGGINWYLWLAIGGIVLGLVGYGAWEWRQELTALISRAKQRFVQRTK